MSVGSHLKAEHVTFLGTNVQRRATPEVTSVDVGSVSQKVTDDQVVVGRHGDLKSCLHTHGPGYRCSLLGPGIQVLVCPQFLVVYTRIHTI